MFFQCLIGTYTLSRVETGERSDLPRVLMISVNYSGFWWQEENISECCDIGLVEHIGQISQHTFHFIFVVLLYWYRSQLTNCEMKVVNSSSGFRLSVFNFKTSDMWGNRHAPETSQCELMKSTLYSRVVLTPFHCEEFVFQLW